MTQKVNHKATHTENFSPSPKRQELLAESLKKAQRLGASQAEISISENSGFAVNVRLGVVDTLEHYQDQSLTATLYFGQKKAQVTTADLRQSAINLALAKATEIAKYMDEDLAAGIAPSSSLAYRYPDLDLYHDWDISVATAIDLARECEALGMRPNSKIENSEGASVNTAKGHVYYGNTHGFQGDFKLSEHSISCALIAGSGEKMQRDFGFTVARDPLKLCSPREVADEAVMRTERRLLARKIPTQKCAVIFAPETARDLINTFLSAINGHNLYRKASFLVDTLNTKVFAEHIAIFEKSHLLQGLGSAPFDAEGVTTRDRTIVNAGIVQSYVLDSYAARKLNLATTGNAGGVHNIFIESRHGLITQAALFAKMHKGLLVTELLGHGVNLATGDYSFAAFGFWVENGAIQYPVSGITIAANLRDIFQNIVALGNDIDVRSKIQTGSLLVETITVAGE